MPTRKYKKIIITSVKPNPAGLETSKCTPLRGHRKNETEERERDVKCLMGIKKQA
jgi:hypothetical protein